ncbi:hypothetical protein [Hymenobacter roseosalivarius]|uniref:hypothetical protein n=1 Tax=Hymenobacter roseosalivarius TaxID=89967 RepID=UPI001F1FF661|nr:hypothetical protein [Hymenobacter roseosalivarius]
MKEKQVKNSRGNSDINIPPQDIKTEPGQPTFKQTLQKILAKPKKKNQSPSHPRQPIK